MESELKITKDVGKNKLGSVNGKKDIVLIACPVADKRGPCSRNCGGGWPGTRATTEQLTEALHNGGIDPERLGCGPLVERARVAVSMLEDIQKQYT